ncbi:strictosidine synthase subfamily protein [Besnoitia besnoiti]|uniref:Strictosidine synthase subfamily protein n=1 Tax=Besnoitia besnoiti TaxID=94643 RepID=A0A2A9M4F6_BESBE|nr:strictosidine synthase subfamily protein [Besnoitia besnoiti]PFH32104.1 strictosidine synthase subfamily protein [Besnoitia besnoiti]
MKFVTIVLPVTIALALDTLFYAGSGRKRIFDSIFQKIDDSRQEAEWLALRRSLKPGDVTILEYGGSVQGAESFLQDPAGGVYTGLIDGRIVKLLNDDEYVDIACLGLQFLDPVAAAAGPDKTLLVVDVFRGLLKVPVPLAPDGRPLRDPSHFDVLLSEADGQRFYFANALLKHDDCVYFTDSSRTNNFGTKGRIILEPESTGRLIEFNLRTKRANVLLEGLDFPNGLAFSPNRQAILMAETKLRSIKKVHIAGPRKGEVEEWARDLPFTPDNITELPNGLGYIVGSAFMRKLPSAREASNSTALRILRALHRRVSNYIVFNHRKTVGRILYPLTEVELLSHIVDWLLTRMGAAGHLFLLDETGKVRRWIALPSKCSAVSEGFLASWDKVVPEGHTPLSKDTHFLLVGSFTKSAICKVPLGALLDPK